MALTSIPVKITSLHFYWKTLGEKLYILTRVMNNLNCSVNKGAEEMIQLTKCLMSKPGTRI